MKDWPAGTHLVFQCSDGRYNTDLIAVGYKYSSSSVSVFVASKEAGRTIKGIPYEAKYLDEGHPSPRNHFYLLQWFKRTRCKQPRTAV